MSILLADRFNNFPLWASTWLSTTEPLAVIMPAILVGSERFMPLVMVVESVSLSPICKKLLRAVKGPPRVLVVPSRLTEYVPAAVTNAPATVRLSAKVREGVPGAVEPSTDRLWVETVLEKVLEVPISASTRLFTFATVPPTVRVSAQRLRLKPSPCTESSTRLLPTEKLVFSKRTTVPARLILSYDCTAPQPISMMLAVMLIKPAMVESAPSPATRAVAVRLLRSDPLRPVGPSPSPAR